MPLSLLALALLCWLSCLATAEAQPPYPHRIWSGLVLATNGPHPGEPPEHLRKVAGKLKDIFGYNHFEIVGEYSEKVDDNGERWLVPSKDFYMSVRSGAGPGANHPMKIVLFQSRRRLAELEAHLGPDSPLFIRGPQYAHGQLIIVLREPDPSEFPAHPSAVHLTPLPTHEKTPLLLPAGGPPQKDKLLPIPPDHFSPVAPEHPGDLDLKSA
jgi:hypothetical protein